MNYVLNSLNSNIKWLFTGELYIVDPSYEQEFLAMRMSMHE